MVGVAPASEDLFHLEAAFFQRTSQRLWRKQNQVTYRVGPRPRFPIEARYQTGHIGGFEHQTASGPKTTAACAEKTERVRHMLNHVPANRQIECLGANEGRVFQLSREDIQLQIGSRRSRGFCRKFHSRDLPAPVASDIHKLSPGAADFEKSATRGKALEPVEFTVSAMGDRLQVIVVIHFKSIGIVASQFRIGGCAVGLNQPAGLTNAIAGKPGSTSRSAAKMARRLRFRLIYARHNQYCPTRAGWPPDGSWIMSMSGIRAIIRATRLYLWAYVIS